MELTEDLIRKVVFTSYVGYFCAAGVSIVLYAVEQDLTLLTVVCFSVPTLHFSFILAGIWLRARFPDTFGFYEPYPDVRVPQWVLYASDWTMAMALGMTIVLFVPLEPRALFAFVAAALVMLGQVVCFLK